MRHPRITLAALALALGACTAEPLSAPGTDPAALLPSAESSAAGRIQVMSRNLYIGADVDRVIAALMTADPLDDLPALLGALAIVQATDLPSRAFAVAGEIATHRPHVVGLQEVYQLDVDLTPLGIPAPVVHQDFLAILQAALAAHGLDYVVAAKVQNTVAAPLPGVSLVDWDVVLIDNSRTTLEAVLAANNFQYNIGPVAAGVTIVRGYVAVQVAAGGQSYTVLNTHLESGGGAQLTQLRAAQAIEIATVLGSASPAILLGDFNDFPGSPMHQVLVGAGFGDVWGDLRPGTDGYTCCHDEDLSNTRADFNQRIDYIFARGTGRIGEKLLGRVVRTGLLPNDRVAGPLYPLWPSDHAGLMANLLTPRP